MRSEYPLAERILGEAVRIAYNEGFLVRMYADRERVSIWNCSSA
ncbi:MAG: hypothetical protein R3C42_04145 [Parvularculaceae bacterium]